MIHRRSAPWPYALLLTSVLATGCGSAAAPSGSTITSLTITGANALSAIGQKTTLVAVGNRADATTTIITQSATWQSSNANVVGVSAGVATAIAAGSAVVTASYQGMIATLTISVVPQADCFSYDASNWQISEESTGFLLNGTLANTPTRVFVFDTRSDASNGLAVYQRFSNACYVGRSNSRADRSAYVFHYWTDPTGRSTTVQPEDCEPYVASTLAVVSAGTSGWSLNAGSRQLLLLDSADDANTMLAVAQRYSSQCFIGRGNTRANSSTYILRYWK